MARPGEKYDYGTKLYPIFTTSVGCFAEFGFGTSLYFTTVLFLAVTTGLAGLANIFLIVSYGRSSTMKLTFADLLTYGSAHCNNTQTVDITNFIVNTTTSQCYPDYGEGRQPRIYPSQFTYNVYTQTCEVVKNTCVPNFYWMGLVNYGTMIWVTIAMYLFFFVIQKKLYKEYDDTHLTTSDYAIEVKNPPKRAVDPNEWKDFFTQFSEKFVSSVTVVINNRDLVRTLVKRRLLLEQLKFMLPRGVDIKNIELLRSAIQKEVTPKWKNMFQPLGFCHTPLSLFKEIDDVEKVIRKLAKDEQIDDVKHVFVTFETTNGQKTALEALSFGLLDNFFNSKMSAIPKFRDTYLKIEEAAEASAVRWEDLDNSIAKRVMQQVGTTLCSLLVILVAASAVVFIDNNISDYWSFGTAYFISFLNVAVPMCCRIITSYESHPREGEYQRSLYFKIVVFRLVNTVIVQYMVTPFTEITRESGNDASLMMFVSTLYYSEMVITPLCWIFDPYTIYSKFIAAPRALSQDTMDSYFKGDEFGLAERYTSLTNSIFFCFFYATVFPASYLFCSMSLWAIFYVDKYILLRRCGRGSKVGPSISKLSSTFFTTAIMMSFIMSAYWWSAFPFDNVYENNGKYYTINQDMLSEITSYFPALPKYQTLIDQPIGLPKEWKDEGWMSSDQGFIVCLIGTTSAVILFFFVLFYGNKIFQKIHFLIFPSYKLEQSDERSFSHLENRDDVFLYVPQVKDPGLLFPVLSCNISDIHHDFLLWKDPDDTSNYDQHNSVCDLRDLGFDVDGKKHYFSVVKQWTNM
mmetsp:Transcript_35932/g.83825  ORF Transcript_35932/g.83825 Transcript_35932/m.83825 type:complete len:799 (+) Transcript_35932:803-3199(+)